MKTQDSRIFRNKLDLVARTKRLPLRVMFELTYRCNFKCAYCYNSDKQKKTSPLDELNTQQVFKVLRQLRDAGCFYLGFTGGEIFCRKDALEIIRYAKISGFQVGILTNGSLINRRIAEGLSKIRPDKIDITVQAIDREVFDKIAGVNGAAARVFRAIRMLRSRKIPMFIKSTVLRENKNEIIKISRFARGLQSGFRFDGELTARSDGSRSPLKYLVPHQETYSLQRQCNPAAHKIMRFRKRNLSRLFNCGAGYTDATINPFGELNICIDINFPRYNILRGTLNEGWQKIKDFIDNIHPPENWECFNCGLARYCAWCPGKSYLQNGNFTGCDAYSRINAEFNRELARIRPVRKQPD